MRLPGQAFCQARKGILSLRECGRPAFSSCEACGTGLCEAHQILTESGVFCPDCAVRDERFVNLEDERLERARYRMGYTQYYEDGSYYQFTTTDFETFDAEAREGGEQVGAEGVLATEEESDDGISDSDDLDSSMES